MSQGELMSTLSDIDDREAYRKKERRITYQFMFFLFVGLISADTECPIVTSIGDRRADKSKLRLVQYNVEWLFIDLYL